MATIETRHGFTSLPPTGLTANLPARLTPIRAFLMRWMASSPLILLAPLAAALLAAVPTRVTAEERPLSFERDVRPIFREFCFDCHGAGPKPDGGLDLRLVRFLQKGGDSGPALVPGDVDGSYLLDRVKSGEMPPGEAHLPPAQLAILEKWVAAGAPTLRPEPETIGPGIPISVEDRSYWAYQPIQRPEIPAFPEAERVRNPIDALVRQAMPAGLTFSPDADRTTLIKRVYFDLLGLPPTADELIRWQTAAGSNWYEELIDTLLQSPHYGERWGRHWLDVAGYADSEGYTIADAERASAWKFRDYVIRSLNADKPFDRFITEQLAGDELAGPKTGDWTPQQIELLTATGFLRMAADGTGSGDNSPEARNKVMADTLKIVGSSLLGSSLACAQCHDHRYDPISHTDYFAVRAVFEPALDWQQWRVPGEREVSLYTEADRAKAAAVEAEVQKIAAEKNTKQTEYMAQALEKELMKYEEPLRGQLKAAYQAAEKDRTPEQKELLAKNPSVNISPGVLYQYLPDAAEDLKKFDARIEETRKGKPVEEFVRALVEPAGHNPTTKLFHRGDFQQPREEVAPAGLTVLAPEGSRFEIPAKSEQLPTTGRRLAFARWLTGGQNPIVPRVLVNRIWMHHFGQGIVSTPGEFGKLGSEPTHPQLLDWLASEFMASGWSLKALHRTILLSTTWRQSSVREPQRTAIDPDNRYYGRKPLQRLDAEIIRDRMLTASGGLARDLFGPPVAIKEDETGQVTVDGSQTRRSLYIRVRRTQPVAMLQTFDAPVMEINCEARPVSTVATQSLMLLNGEFTLEQAGRVADRASAEAATAPPLPPEIVSALPALPPTPPPTWTYGHGVFDEAAQRTARFALLAHWTGSQWQGGEKLPDPTIGWPLLHPSGGHPGNTEFAAIRRWTAPANGTLTISGTLSHGSPSGDGVRGRIVSSSRGLLATGTAANGKAEIHAADVSVQEGETIDFIADCITNENSDSFGWPVKVTLAAADGTRREYDSVGQFHGPLATESLTPQEIHRAWQLILCRAPQPEEFTLAMTFAGQQLREIHRDPRAAAAGRSAGRQVLVNLCQMLMNSNEFLYID
ncbi:PSD1 and planctomycete cytochrome C domain-containing protein [Planctomyces sp. SH-PL14]|uniref:PSD1 and planctomycete cytochrome C domain-containing protein n=1 Tax=Planctomyces sp. SH-PL14 TaxID=1632864 RepID=UPI000946615A|nr:PSD1 and planctomycete cytochrome C domain-containing protein [Planctomyces sp. SH-PL14]